MPGQPRAGVGMGREFDGAPQLRGGGCVPFLHRPGRGDRGQGNRRAAPTGQGGHCKGGRRLCCHRIDCRVALPLEFRPEGRVAQPRDGAGFGGLGRVRDLVDQAQLLRPGRVRRLGPGEELDGLAHGHASQEPADAARSGQQALRQGGQAYPRAGIADDDPTRAGQGGFEARTKH